MFLQLLETAELRCESFAVSDYRSLHQVTIPDSGQRISESRMGEEEADIDLKLKRKI